tara:strand:+ start:638 stop:1033 length:396 start_codon:yes stop_codon:yes gene_type:complete
MHSKPKIKLGSNKSFGLVFFVVFLIISLWPSTYDSNARIFSGIISLIFLFLGLINSKFLTPLNKIWMKFGLFLGAIISPIVMGVVFFFVVTPIGLIMRVSGKDLLNMKRDNKKKSYWIKRNKPIDTMKRQF